MGLHGDRVPPRVSSIRTPLRNRQSFPDVSFNLPVFLSLSLSVSLFSVFQYALGMRVFVGVFNVCVRVPVFKEQP